jgi:hypothetical protein
MFFRCAWSTVIIMAASAFAQAQNIPPTVPAKPTGRDSAPGWRAPAPGDRVARANPDDATLPATPNAPLRSIDKSRTPIARSTAGPGSLPNDAGQVWRDYDISPYTTRVTATNRPEQAIVDWILRETGYEAWHGETVAVLTADRRTLHAYHTPDVQAVVAEMVDRFVNTEAESHGFNIRILSVGNPNWRSKAQRVLRPVAAQSQGVQAWLLAKEDAALLVADVSRRNDFREYGTPQLLVNNGQSTVVSAIRPKTFIRDVLYRGDVWPGFEPQMAQVDEGFSLEFSPLVSLDGQMIDAVVKCNVDQIEKMIPVNLDVPTQNAPRQRTKVEVPQMIGCRLQERFRFPADQVLLISLGVVATPTPAANNGLPSGIPLISSNTRADLLVLVESKGKASSSAPPPQAVPPTATRGGSLFRGRL